MLLLPLIVKKSDSYRKSNKEKKQNTYTKSEAKKIKSNNLTRSHKDKLNIAIAILENEQFGWTNNIFSEPRTPLLPTLWVDGLMVSGE